MQLDRFFVSLIGLWNVESFLSNCTGEKEDLRREVMNALSLEFYSSR